MKDIKKGTIVTRKSYNDDILFRVEEIINTTQGRYAILKGITIRIKANSPIEDLNILDKSMAKNEFDRLNERIESRITENRNFVNNYINILCGKILHLDGDRRYAEKSAKYYRKMGLNAIVKSVSENKQPMVVGNLVKRYKPDILVITGHDGMIKNGTGFTDIYNYRNSRYFINTVKIAKKWVLNSGKDLVIFAGACQSYYEALVSAGANFASSPARVLIDFMDPLIVAEKVATTEEYKYITIKDIADELRDGTKGVGGIGARGKKTKSTI